MCEATLLPEALLKVLKMEDVQTSEVLPNYCEEKWYVFRIPSVTSLTFLFVLSAERTICIMLHEKTEKLPISPNC